MVGRDDSVHNLGIAPCSIGWLFKLIDEKREKYVNKLVNNFTSFVEDFFKIFV